MRRWATLCMLALVLAGCSGSSEDPSSTTDASSSSRPFPADRMPGAGTSTSGSPPPAGGGGGNGTTPALTVTLAANRTVALVPANITFTLGASQNGTWTLTFGDGAKRDGTALPATVPHTYTAAGNVTARLEVRTPGGVVANDTVLLAIRTAATAPPPQLVFEFGESAGCASDANAISEGAVPPNCASFHAGPDAPAAVDGHWLPLTEQYWGLTVAVVSDAASGDSDCFFVAPDATTIIGEGHNGGEECMGVVPAGAGYIFLYPWGSPATHMTATFTV